MKVKGLTSWSAVIDIVEFFSYVAYTTEAETEELNWNEMEKSVKKKKKSN